jgi:hypothetical protein
MKHHASLPVMVLYAVHIIAGKTAVSMNPGEWQLAAAPGSPGPVLCSFSLAGLIIFLLVL